MIVSTRNLFFIHVAMEPLFVLAAAPVSSGNHLAAYWVMTTSAGMLLAMASVISLTKFSTSSNGSEESVPGGLIAPRFLQC